LAAWAFAAAMGRDIGGGGGLGLLLVIVLIVVLLGGRI
jgi:hypothetical protein